MCIISHNSLFRSRRSQHPSAKHRGLIRVDRRARRKFHSRTASTLKNQINSQSVIFWSLDCSMTVTEQVPHSPNFNLPPLSYNDPAFEPQVGFEFEEPDDESFLRQATDSSPFHLSSIQTDRGIARGGSQDDNVSIYGDGVALKSSPDESTIAEEADPLLLSAPCHGVLNEPDDAKGAKTTAIQRHARSKKARDALLCEASLDPLVDVNNVKNTKVQCEMYRNKNRLAAVRCRAKKRLNVGRLEERHRVLSANSSYMKREELRLRNQLTQLRTTALRHDTDLCSCRNIHAYNRHQANKVGTSSNQPKLLPSDLELTSNASLPGIFYHETGRHPREPDTTHCERAIKATILCGPLRMCSRQGEDTGNHAKNEAVSSASK